MTGFFDRYPDYLFLAGLVSIILALVVYSRKTVPGSKPFVVMMLGLSIYSVSYAMELMSHDLREALFWVRVEYVAIVLVPISWLAFSLEYAGKEEWLTRRNLFLLGIEPVLVLALVFSNDLHRLFWTEASLVTNGALSFVEFNRAAGFWIHSVYSYLILLAGSLFLIQTALHTHNIFRSQAMLILSSVWVMWGINILYLIRIDSLPPVDLTPLAFMVAGLLLAWAFMSYRFLDIVPTASPNLISNLQDGLIVLDASERVVDLNPAAEKIIGKTASEMVGMDSGQVHWSNGHSLASLIGQDSPTAEIVITGNQDHHNYELRASIIKDRSGNKTGRLIVMRDITEQVKAIENLDCQAAILEAVSFAGAKFMLSHSWEENVRDVLKRLGEAARVSRVYIYENHDHAKGGLRASLRYEWAVEGSTAQPVGSLLQDFSYQESGFGGWETTLSRNQPVFGVVEEFPSSEQSALSARQVQSLIVVPVFVGEKWWGFIGFDECAYKRSWSNAEIDALEVIANALGSSIQRDQVDIQLSQRADELDILFESSVAMVKALELGEVSRIAAEHLARAIGSTSAHMLSCNLVTGKCEVMGEYFSPQADNFERVSSLGEVFDLNEYPKTLAALRAGNTLPIKLSDPDIDPNDWKEMSTHHIKSSLCMPMTVSDRVLAYVEIWDSRSERDWSEEEIRFCQTLANQAAIVIENARLYSEMQHQAITDALTGVLNRRGLFENGQREVVKAWRYTKPLSAIMLDIDHFKRINDTRSHAIGDQVLQGLVDLCQDSLRGMDVLGRYGGEEFAILLPETEVDPAYLVAQRLRRRVADTPIITRHGPVSITISLGVSCMSGEVMELAVLLDRADTAMYAAKRGGRNQVARG